MSEALNMLTDEEMKSGLDQDMTMSLRNMASGIHLGSRRRGGGKGNQNRLDLPQQDHTGRSRSVMANRLMLLWLTPTAPNSHLPGT